MKTKSSIITFFSELIFLWGEENVQALIAGGTEPEWDICERDGFDVGEVTDEPGLTKKKIGIPAAMATHHVVCYYRA